MPLPILCLDFDHCAAPAAKVLAEAGYEVLIVASLEAAQRDLNVRLVGAIVACGASSMAALPALREGEARIGESTVPVVALLPEGGGPTNGVPADAICLRLPGQVGELPAVIRELAARPALADGDVWRKAADLLEEGLLLVDAQGRVGDANAAACDLLALARSRLLGARTSDVLGSSAEDLARLCDGGPQTIETSAGALVLRITRMGDSSTVWRLCKPSGAAAGGDSAADAAQAEPRAAGDPPPAETPWRGLFDSNVVPIFFWSSDGRITAANEAFLALVQRSRAELRAGLLRWDELTAPEHAALDRLAMSQFAAGELARVSYEKDFLLKDGRRVPVLVGGAPLAGRPECGVAFAIDLTSRKRAEKALRESEERLSLALEAGRMGTFEWDLVTGQQAWSAYHYVLLGYVPGECTPSIDVWRERVHPDDRSAAEAALREAVAEGRDFRHEYRVLLPDGDVRWIETAGRCDRDEQERVVRVRGGVVDVTARKLVEQALRASEARAQRIFNSDIVGISYWNLETGRIIDANNQFLAMTGYTREDLAAGGMRWDAMTPPEWAVQNAGAVAELKASGRSHPYEKEYLRKDGSRVPVIVGGALFEGSSHEGVSFVLDISDRKRAEEERARLLAMERQRTARLLKLSEVATAINREPTVETIMHTAAELAAMLLGAHQAAASMTIGQQWAQAVNAVYLSEKYSAWRSYEGQPDGSGIYGLVCRENRPLRLTAAELDEHPAFRRFGTESDRHPPLVGLLAAPLIGRDGSNLGLIQVSDKHAGEFSEEDEALLLQMAQVVALAVEKAHLYQELQEADRRKDEFLATLAHELRNPLAAVSTGIQLLNMPGAREDFDWTIGLIDDQIKQLARLVDDLLDVSRITRGKIHLRLESIDFRQTAERSVGVVQPLLEERGHRLHVELEPRPLWLEADPARLEQILVNLLTNAAKYTDEGGQIWLSAQVVGTELVIRVRDTGIGIPPEMLPRVFELFAQGDQTLDRARGGLGIGLTLVRRLTEMHGGSVAVSSPGVGRGSEFSVRLPLTPQITSSGWFPRLDLDHPRPQPVRVLIVEDNPDIARGAARFLEQCGHEVHVAQDGAGGLELARQVLPQVGVLDIGLPGMDGYQLAAAIRREERLEDCLLIAVTGYGQDQDRQRSRSSGFDYHLVKPVDYRLLQQLLGQWQAARGAAGG